MKSKNKNKLNLIEKEIRPVVAREGGWRRVVGGSEQKVQTFKLSTRDEMYSMMILANTTE